MNFFRTPHTPSETSSKYKLSLSGVRGEKLSEEMFQTPKRLERVGARPMPLTNPSLPDILDILDCMMSHNTDICKKNFLMARFNQSEIRGSEIVSFLIDQRFSETNVGAILLSHHIVQSGGLRPKFRVATPQGLFTPGHSAKYEHRGMAHLMSTGELNRLLTPTSEPASLTEALRNVTLVARLVRKKMFTANGKFIRQISEVRGSSVWRKLLVVTNSLAYCRDDGLRHVDDEEKVALFVNLFNVMMFHRRLVNGHPKSFRDRAELLQNTAYSIAEHRVSAFDIMCRLLRGKLPRTDERHGWQALRHYPHTALLLNWGFHSSPAFEWLDNRDVEGNLLRYTKEYIINEVFIDKKDKVVELPRLFKWIGPNFTESPSLYKPKDFLNRLSSLSRIPAKNDLITAVDEKYMIEYRRFSWADYANQHSTKRSFTTPLLDRSLKKSLSYSV